jgi:MFS family permease
LRAGDGTGGTSRVDSRGAFEKAARCVRDRIKDPNIWLIYAAIFLLGIAYGISISITAIFLDARGYTKSDIGTLAAWFALGIVALSLPMGALIRRFSGRTTLVASLLGYAAVVTAFPYMPSYTAIAGVRFLDGAFSVGIWASCETILLLRSDKDNKAFVTSLYAICMAVGYVLGPVIAKGLVAVAPMTLAFLVSGAIATASALVVLLLLEREPLEDAHVPEPEFDPSLDAQQTGGLYRAPAPTRAPLSSGEILWRIKTSCFAIFAYGYFQASVVLFLPLYLIEAKGIPHDRTIVIPAFFAAGMLLFSNYAGRLGDRYGHLLVMRVLGAIGTAMILGFVFLDAYPLMCAAVFVAGASLASISPVSLALQGAIADRRDYSRANAIYNAVYAAGMLLGPPASSVIYGRLGGVPMLYHLAALWAAFVLFTAVFFRDDPAVARRRAG